MNKAMMFPIHKNWVDKIFKGEKKFEFRNKLPKYLVKGMKIYFYETLGDRKPKDKWEDYPLYIGFDTYEEPYASYVYEGQGMIVGEATVGEIYRKDVHNKKRLITSYGMGDIILGRPLDEEDRIYITDKFKLQGYINQNYAIELTNVIKYDEAPICNTCEEEKGDYHKYNCRKYGMMKQNCIKYVENKNKPTSPIAKEEFVLWNKVKDKKGKDIYIDFEKCNKYSHCSNGYVNGCQFYGDFEFNAVMCLGDDNELDFECPKNRLQSPPQAPVYVVERETK